LFKPVEIKSILKKAQPTLKAMILLGINGGFGNADCATLPLEAIDLKNGVIEYERPKTGVQRIVPLWRETTAALRAVLKRERPKPSKPEYGRLVFLTVFGNPWKHERIVDEDADGVPKVSRQQVISAEFGKLLKRIGLKQSGRGFYSLRHTFRTWADETHDQHAVHRIMGHSIPGMSGVYVEEIGIDRLRAVVDSVRAKVFSTQ
jgi:integrase